MVFVIGLFSEHRRTSAEGFSKVTRHRRVNLWAEVWHEDSSRSPELTGKKSQNNFWKESNSAMSHVTSAISYDSNPFLSPSNTRKNLHMFSPKKPKDNKGHSSWQLEVFLMVMPRYVYTSTRNRKAAAKTLLTINFKQNFHGDSNHPVSRSPSLACSSSQGEICIKSEAFSYVFPSSLFTHCVKNLGQHSKPWNLLRTIEVQNFRQIRCFFRDPGKEPKRYLFRERMTFKKVTTSPCQGWWTWPKVARSAVFRHFDELVTIGRHFISHIPY